ncbi:hypothetical protein HYU19_01875 [Candidatus Woesearchaeota archaeon]|nr:hypothetical protein [Candidatus Woesearchaeota archaeon]
MVNKFGIPHDELLKIRARDKKCVYCQKEMIYPFTSEKQGDCATIEHLNFDGALLLERRIADRRGCNLLW